MDQGEENVFDDYRCKNPHQRGNSYQDDQKSIDHTGSQSPGFLRLFASEHSSEHGDEGRTQGTACRKVEEQLGHTVGGIIGIQLHTGTKSV